MKKFSTRPTFAILATSLCFLIAPSNAEYPSKKVSGRNPKNELLTPELPTSSASSASSASAGRAVPTTGRGLGSIVVAPAEKPASRGLGGAISTQPSTEINNKRLDRDSPGGPAGPKSTSAIGGLSPKSVSAGLDCDQSIQIDAKGRPIYPEGTSEIEPIETIDEDRGPISSLYPDLDTSTDEFYAKLPCEMSLGGELPTELENYSEPPFDESEITKFEQKLAQIEVAVKTPLMPLAMPPMNVTGCMLVQSSGQGIKVSCDDPRLGDPSQPFNGRDVIFVHGLALDQLKLAARRDPAATKQWPFDTQEFLSPNGYFRKYADDYWMDHIRENLSNQKPTAPQGWQWPAGAATASYVAKTNRYLTISYSSNQRLVYSQHAILSQIALAISSMTNVVTPAGYPTNIVKPFCSMGCVIVSHSTGALLTSTALSRASSGYFGPEGRAIPNFIFAHVSFNGATSGSRLATAGLVIATRVALSAPVALGICDIVDKNLGLDCNVDLGFLRNSVLVDLVPLVSQGIWGPIIERSPVPTITIVGGHPFYLNTGSTILGALLPGVDDGVVTANSACGNPTAVQPLVLVPSGMIARSFIKAFDMGVNRGRAILAYMAMKNLKAIPPGLMYFASMCTPYLSSHGMVMPVLGGMAGSIFDSRRRYRNYYSFIQGSIDHSQNGAGIDGNVWPSSVGQPATNPRLYNNGYREESSAVTDGSIYAKRMGSHLVHPSFASSIHEIVRGRRVTFKLFGVRRSFWLWKRTYHLPNHWETMSSAHYVYQFVGRP